MPSMRNKRKETTSSVEKILDAIVLFCYCIYLFTKYLVESFGQYVIESKKRGTKVEFFIFIFLHKLILNTYRTEVINRNIQRRHDLSILLRRQFSLPERVLNVMEDTMLSGVYLRQKRDRRLLKWSFKAKVYLGARAR